MNKGKLSRLIVMFVISFVMVYFLLKNIGFGYLIQTFKKVSIFIFIFGFIFYLISSMFRAIRFYLIFKKTISFRNFFSVVCLHNFFNCILPLRLGELSYIYLLKKHGIKGTKSLFTLGFVRLFDLFVIFLFFFTALFFTTLENPLFNIFLILFFVILLLVFLLIVFFRRAVFNFVININKRTRIKFINKILDKVIETLNHFKIIKSWGLIVGVLSTSILIWFFALMSNYVIVRYFIDIPFWVVVIGACFVMLTYVLPIHGFMGFGTHEGAWALTLLYFGFLKEQAIATGFILHILPLTFAALLGLFGMFKLK